MDDRQFSEAFKSIIRIVGRGKKLQRDLTQEEAAEAIRLMLTDNVSLAQIGAFLVTMRVKEETVDEIIGFTRGARSVMRPFPKPNVEKLVDLALPYDGKAKSIQSGVLVGLFLAAAGLPVLMHGADNIPAKVGVGVLNLLREFGYPVDQPLEWVSRSIEETGFGVLNLAHVLPEWTALTPIRHHFGLRTLMNTTEKLLNPADAPLHVSGFYHGSYLARMAKALPGKIKSWIVQGEEGSIDIRPGKKTRVHLAVGDNMIETMLDAADYGFPNEIPQDVPNDAAVHAGRIRRIFAGEPDPAVDQIILTAAVHFWMLDVVTDIPAGVELARDLLASGAVQAVLEHTEAVGQ